MLGHIKKDFLILKKDSVLFIPAIIIFSVFQTFTANFLSSFYSVGMIFNVFMYEEKGNTNGYLCVLPNGRKNMVVSKYILFILISIFLVIITNIAPIVVSMINGDEILYNFLYVSIPTIVMSIILPLIYLIGVNRTGIFLFIIFFGLFFTLGYLPTISPKIYEYMIFLEGKMYLIFIFSLVMYFISFFISIQINNNKDY